MENMKYTESIRILDGSISCEGIMITDELVYNTDENSGFYILEDQSYIFTNTFDKGESR